MSLDSVIAPRRVEEARFAVEIPDGWQMGRGVFGGLVLANLVRAIDLHAAPQQKDTRRLRTLTAQLCGPLQPGAAEIRVEPLRIGSGNSTVAARIVQAGEVQAHAVAVLGRDRGGEDGDAQPPTMIPWREAPETPGFDGFPTFARNFEYRVTGALPFSGSAEAHSAGWIRAREPGVSRDAGFVVAMADAWWPAIFSRLTAPPVMATVSFTLEWLGELDGLDPAAPLFHDARALATRDGYATELRALWGEDGRLIALNHQTFVVIK